MAKRAIAALVVSLLTLEARWAHAQTPAPSGAARSNETAPSAPTSSQVKTAPPPFTTAPSQATTATPRFQRAPVTAPAPATTTPPTTTPNQAPAVTTATTAPSAASNQLAPAQPQVAPRPRPPTQPDQPPTRNDDDDDDDDDQPRGWPETLPYRDGGPPNGYHFETRVRLGQVIPNGIIFGISHGMAAYAAVETKEPVLAVPLVGPLFLIQEYDKSPSPLGNLLLYSDTIAQTVSAGFIAAAFVFPAREFVRNDIVSGRAMHVASWSIVPAVVARSATGIVVSGTLE